MNYLPFAHAEDTAASDSSYLERDSSSDGLIAAYMYAGLRLQRDEKFEESISPFQKAISMNPFLPHTKSYSLVFRQSHEIGHASMITIVGNKILDSRAQDASVKLSILHEIGHALGMPHSLDPDDVMYGICFNAQLTKPSARDANTLKKLYEIK